VVAEAAAGKAGWFFAGCRDTVSGGTACPSAIWHRQLTYPDLKNHATDHPKFCNLINQPQCMLRVFRKLRQHLLDQYKFSRYLLYAIGEILLVVIGILIALQVDTWNKGRELRAEELELLKNFKASLAKDIVYMQGSKTTYEKARNSLDFLIDYMEQDLPYVDSLKYHFANITFDWGLQ